MWRWIFGLALWAITAVVSATEVRVAVAANFLAPLQALAEAFEAAGGPPVRISSGATGQHYAQIVNGAPFDVFLAADQARPARLVGEGLALRESRFTYAEGRLVLWARPEAELPEAGFAGLAGSSPRRLAIANPRLAPYGAAARAALQASDQWQALQPRIIQGQNVGQALQYLATGNASHALVAASYVHRDGRPPGAWVAVPSHLHAPIRQDAVQLVNAPAPAAARRFLAFLRGATAAAIIERFGYQAPGARQ